MLKAAMAGARTSAACRTYAQGRAGATSTRDWAKVLKNGSDVEGKDSTKMLSDMVKEIAHETSGGQDANPLGNEILPQFDPQFPINATYTHRDLMFRERPRRSPPARDVFEARRINPLHHYKNCLVLSRFVTEMGKIKPAEETGLKAKTQRKLSKAIRRARAMRLFPTHHQHPQMTRRPSFS